MTNGLKEFFPNTYPRKRNGDKYRNYTKDLDLVCTVPRLLTKSSTLNKYFPFSNVLISAATLLFSDLVLD